eukprot:XP_011665428.1 PREDICTED: trichohyalin-like [Strongylocentrotus purpuratus]
MPHRILSYEDQLQRLDLIHGCLQEGDRALAINEQKEMYLARREVERLQTEKEDERTRAEKEKRSLAAEMTKKLESKQHHVDSLTELLEEKERIETTLRQQVEELKKRGEEDRTRGEQEKRSLAADMAKEIESKKQRVDSLTEIVGEKERNETSLKQQVEELKKEGEECRMRGEQEKRSLAAEMSKKLETKQHHVDSLTENIREKERNETTLRQQVEELKKEGEQERARGEKRKLSLTAEMTKKLESKQKGVDTLTEIVEEKERNETSLKQQVEELKKGGEEDRTRGKQEKRSLAAVMTKEIESKQQRVDSLTEMLEEKERNETTLRQQVEELKKEGEEDRARGELEKRSIAAEMSKKLESKKQHVDSLTEMLEEKERNETTLRQQMEELKNETKEDIERFEKEKRSVEQLERETWKLRTKIQLESEMRSAEQKNKAETPQWMQSFIPWMNSGKQDKGGTSLSEDNSTGGMRRSDTSQAGEEPPDDEFAEILNQMADYLYDAAEIDSLGGQLGIKQGDIQRAHMTNMRFNRVTSDGTRHMLKQWRRGVSREDERMELWKVLRAAKLVNIAEQFLREDTQMDAEYVNEHADDQQLSTRDETSQEQDQTEGHTDTKVLRGATATNDHTPRDGHTGDMASKTREDLPDGSRSQHPDKALKRSIEKFDASAVISEDVSSGKVNAGDDMTNVSSIQPSEPSSSHGMQVLPEDMSGIAPLVSSGSDDYILSDRDRLQWLDLLHGCLQEGDRVLAINELKRAEKEKRSLAAEMTKKLETKQHHVDSLTELPGEKERNETTLKQQVEELKKGGEEDRTRGEQEKRSLAAEITKEIESKQQRVDSLTEIVREKERNESSLKQQVEELTKEGEEDRARGESEKHSLAAEMSKKLESKQHHVDSLTELPGEKERNETTLRQQVEELKKEREEDRARGEQEKHSLTAEMTKEIEIKQQRVETLTELLEEKEKNETTLRQQAEESKKEKEEYIARFEKQKRSVEQLERETWKLRTKIRLESEMRSAEQIKKKAETHQWSFISWVTSGKQAHSGTSSSEDNSSGGMGRSDTSQAREEPPDDEFADILKQIADDLYDEAKIDSLGGQLGILQGDIQRAHMTNMRFNRVTSDGTRHMLNQWREGVSREDERIELRNALVAARLLNLAEVYFPQDEAVGASEPLNQERKDLDDREHDDETIAEDITETNVQPDLQEYDSIHTNDGNDEILEALDGEMEGDDQALQRLCSEDHDSTTALVDTEETVDEKSCYSWCCCFRYTHIK